MSVIVLVDYGSGNLHSAFKALQLMADQVIEKGAKTLQVVVSSSPEEVLRADRVVLPGDGAFPACRQALIQKKGLVEALSEVVLHKGRPFMGICVGMQMLASTGREYEETAGLGWIAGDVRRIKPKDIRLKVPHTGWNELILEKSHPVMEGIKTGDHAYFVHSYQFETAHSQDRLAYTNYAADVTAIVGRDNIIGFQFHPEKSQKPGLRLIANFLNWKP